MGDCLGFRWIYAFTAALLIIGFNNCADQGGEATPSALTDLDNGALSGVDVAEVQLRVLGGDPVYIRKGDISFNVGGDCSLGDEGTQGVVEWALEDLNGSSSVTSGNNYGLCQNGRFFVYVPLPVGFNYDMPYVLKLDLRAMNEKNQEVGRGDAAVGIQAIAIQ